MAEETPTEQQKSFRERFIEAAEAYIKARFEQDGIPPFGSSTLKLDTPETDGPAQEAKGD